MQRWFNQERALLIPSLRYANVTAIATEEVFPKLGDPLLAKFWIRATQTGNTVGSNLYRPQKKAATSPILHNVYVPDTTRYFITAMPFNFKRSKINEFSFESSWIRDVAMVALNSNVFYWLWHVLGDGFDVTGNNVCAMVLPEVREGDGETVRFRDALLSAADSCATVKIRSGEAIPNFNFNKRMDILLDIDAWIVKHIAPDLKHYPCTFESAAP